MNISSEQALKYYKYELETKVNKLKKEILNLSISIKNQKELISGYNPELANSISDDIFNLKNKQKELSKILYIIGD